MAPTDLPLRLPIQDVYKFDERRVEVESLIDARYSLSEGAEAFAHSRRNGVIKVLIDVDENIGKSARGQRE